MNTREKIKTGLECCLCDYYERKCDECPYAKNGEETLTCEEQLGKDTLNLIRQLEAQVPKWISVKTPPKKPGEYIVLIRYPDGRSIRTFNIFHPDAGWCPNDLVEAVQTHWMSFYSLPEPPKEDDHAENDRS